MDWIKRNLFFVIGAGVAVLLLGVAGYYTWSGYSHNATAREELNAKYSELKRLYESPLSPGDGEKVDNIKAAREQLAEVRKVRSQTEQRFQRTPGIVVGDKTLSGTNVTIEGLSRGMSETIKELQRNAANSGVTLPLRYNFSFEQEADKVRLTPSSLPLLAEQLSEVKILAEVLINAKVNSIDAIQRERVAPEDYSGAQGDYIEAHSVTNDLAVITPYQLVFRSFTPELAGVLCGYAGVPYGIVVKRVNVEPAVSNTTQPGYPGVIAQPYTPPAYVQPIAPQPRYPDRYADRYGEASGKFPGASPYPSPYPQPVAPVVAPTAAQTGPKTVLDEKQLRVTMQLEIIKPLPTN